MLLGPERFVLALMGVAEYQRWQNELFPNNYFGLGVHAQSRLLLIGPFAAVGGAGWTWNLVNNTNQNAVGTPRSNLAMRAGIEMAISDRNALELTYRGDVLAYGNDYRVTNGLSIGFGTAF
jgi:hypothetical protein